jgi:hypothetical protein
LASNFQRVASDGANRVLVLRDISILKIRKPDLNQPQHDTKDHRGRNPE